MQHDHEPHQGVTKTSQSVTDPVCGMQVDPNTALTLDHDGTTYHFCSDRCRDRFRHDPASFLTPPQDSDDAAPRNQDVNEDAAEWTCPMHPEAVSYTHLTLPTSDLV